MITKVRILTILGGTLSAIALTTGVADAQSTDNNPQNTPDHTPQYVQKPDQDKPTDKQSSCGCCKTMKACMDKMQPQTKPAGEAMPEMNHSGMTQ
jgi:hypothetical protein